MRPVVCIENGVIRHGTTSQGLLSGIGIDNASGTRLERRRLWKQTHPRPLAPFGPAKRSRMQLRLWNSLPLQSAWRAGHTFFFFFNPEAVVIHYSPYIISDWPLYNHVSVYRIWQRETKAIIRNGYHNWCHKWYHLFSSFFCIALP